MCLNLQLISFTPSIWSLFASPNKKTTNLQTKFKSQNPIFTNSMPYSPKSSPLSLLIQIFLISFKICHLFSRSFSILQNIFIQVHWVFLMCLHFDHPHLILIISILTYSNLNSIPLNSIKFSFKRHPYGGGYVCACQP